MTLPRDLVPGSTYVLTRHCTHHIPLLSLTPEVRQIFLYILGTALADRGVRLHAFALLPNGWRAVFTDLKTNVPRFAHSVHRRSALRLNRMFGRRENFWSNRRYHIQRLETGADVLEAIVETITLPVELGIVEELDDWSGLVTRPQDFVDVIRVRRPAAMARVKDAPGRTCVRHWVPRAFRRKNKGSWVVKLQVMVANRVDALQRQDHPMTPLEPAFPPPTSPIPTPKDSPLTFVRTSHPAIRRQKLLQHKLFHARYPKALAQWRTPDRSALFPFGTFWMRVFHKASVANSPHTARPHPR